MPQPTHERLPRLPTGTAARAGVTYDHDAIVEWLQNKQTDPSTNQPLSIDQLCPNRTVRTPPCDPTPQPTPSAYAAVRSHAPTNPQRRRRPVAGRAAGLPWAPQWFTPSLWWFTPSSSQIRDGCADDRA